MFLAVLCALAVLTAVVLYLRLRKREAPSVAGDSRERSRSANPSPSAALESTAIDHYLYDRCCRFMTERKPFLVPSFTIQDLANALYTNKVYLSKTIYQYSGKHFRAYVNYYRVMYAMELYRSNMSLRITDLSELSGFSSTTAFFQSFKKVMGEAPSYWCARMRRSHRSSLRG